MILATSFICLLCLSCSALAQDLWDAQRDDLAEYQLERAAVNVRSEAACLMMADASHQAVEFSQDGGGCRVFSCLLGWSGCRKCRNARNSSLPLLLVRRANELGHTCWRTFQHRVDGSVDFYRNWTDYLSVFGQGENQNHWMGLEAIHQLTRNGDRRVRWEMSMWNDTWFWWENQFFTVQGASQGYRVTIGVQDTSRSNVIQCLYSHVSFMNNQNFSTPDKDQDSSPESCSVKFQGSWWYGSCHCFNPNGRYFTPPTAVNLVEPLWADGLTFTTPGGQYPLNHYYSMKTFECMVSDSL